MVQAVPKHELRVALERSGQHITRSTQAFEREGVRIEAEVGGARGVLRGLIKCDPPSRRVVSLLCEPLQPPGTRTDIAQNVCW